MTQSASADPTSRAMEVSVAVFEMNMREDYVRRIRDRRSVLYDDIVYSKLYQSSQKIVTRLYYATEPYGSTPTTDCSRQRNARVLPDARSPGRPRIAGALALSDALVCHPRNRKVICDPPSAVGLLHRGSQNRYVKSTKKFA